MRSYTEDFYQNVQEWAQRSAKEIVPLVFEFIRPQSVIDVGCGTGTWLSAFDEYGVKDFLGIDGDHVRKDMLQIPTERFLALDLTKPFHLDRQFDLVISLEVAEHLPRECAGTFIGSLTELAPVALFSAAIPFQGGTDHVNEQWPSYWAERFREKEYLAVDCLRERVWQNENVAWFYAQNMLIFVRSDFLENHPVLKKEFENTDVTRLAKVHPQNYLEKGRLADYSLATPDLNNVSLKMVLSALPTVTRKALKRRARGLRG